MRRVVGLGGGIGASRLWCALAGAVDLTVVVNTGDNLWYHGLRVCPDIDTVLYALSGRQDLDRGWGVTGETWRCMDALRDLGEDVWFNLGDLDLATHLRRTGLLRSGLGLAEVTLGQAAALGVEVRVPPATEAELTTRIETADGHDLHYEEFLVRHGAAVPVSSVRYAGASVARPAPGVAEAVAAADVVILGPSNPVASIGPILAVPGLGDAIRLAANVVAVTPIVGGVPVAERARSAGRGAGPRCSLRPRAAAHVHGGRRAVPGSGGAVRAGPR